MIPDDYIPLAESLRGGHVETVHAGCWMVVDASGTPRYETLPSFKPPVFLRSAAKPFQGIPLLQAGLSEALGESALALACGSHGGTEVHVAEVQRILTAAKASSTALQCGTMMPLDRATRHRLIANAMSPTVLHHCCSGQHAAMLWACRQHGWDLTTYMQPEHPLQQAIQAELQSLLGHAATDGGHDVLVALDDCGLPAYLMSLRACATLFARLASDSALQPIAHAMGRHPQLVSGIDRVDAAIMVASEGRLVCKGGADGVIGVSRIANHDRPGEGLCLKIADGHEAIRNRVLVHLLVWLGWLSPTMSHHPDLVRYLTRQRVSPRGEEVGTFRFLSDTTRPDAFACTRS